MKKDNFDAPLFDQLKSFVHLNAMTKGQQEEKQMTFFDTPLGEVGADEMQVLLWLEKSSILSAGPGREPLGIEKSLISNKNLFKTYRF